MAENGFPRPSRFRSLSLSLLLNESSICQRATCLSSSASCTRAAAALLTRLVVQAEAGDTSVTYAASERCYVAAGGRPASLLARPSLARPSGSLSVAAASRDCVSSGAADADGR